MGDICFAGGNVKFNQSGENNYTQARETIPVGYRPAETSNVPIAVFGGNGHGTSLNDDIQSAPIAPRNRT